MASQRVKDSCAPPAACCLPRHVTMTAGAAGGHAVHESGPMPERTDCVVPLDALEATGLPVASRTTLPCGCGAGFWRLSVTVWRHGACLSPAVCNPLARCLPQNAAVGVRCRVCLRLVQDLAAEGLAVHDRQSGIPLPPPSSPVADHRPRCLRSGLLRWWAF